MRVSVMIQRDNGISWCDKLLFQFLSQFVLTDCLGLEGLDDSGPCARGCLLLPPPPEHCPKAPHLVSVLFCLNAVQLVWLQSQLHPHFPPQGRNLSSHLVQKINISGLVVQSSILMCVCKHKNQYWENNNDTCDYVTWCM